jgi:Na+-transporting methylmalonyl-CoA/oxaloacetate decarboxylase gamma subunit
MLNGRGASAPLAVLYAWQDYALAAFVLVALLLWIVFEFLGALAAVQRFMGKMSGQTPASAEEAAERVVGYAYAATRNDKQRRGRN